MKLITLLEKDMIQRVGFKKADDPKIYQVGRSLRSAFEEFHPSDKEKKGALDSYAEQIINAKPAKGFMKGVKEHEFKQEAIRLINSIKEKADNFGILLKDFSFEDPDNYDISKTLFDKLSGDTSESQDDTLRFYDFNIDASLKSGMLENVVGLLDQLDSFFDELTGLIAASGEQKPQFEPGEEPRVGFKLKELYLEQRSIPTDTPNEFAYLDFKKWVYKNRGKIKQSFEAIPNMLGSTSKYFNTMTDFWVEWARKTDNTAFSVITDSQKFGRALIIMLRNDNLIFSKETNRITKLKERPLTKGEEKDKEKIVKGLKGSKSDFKKHYGKDAEAVMYATATKRAKLKEFIKKTLSENLESNIDYTEFFEKMIDQLARLDISIDYLTSTFTKLSPADIDYAQGTLGKLAKPVQKSPDPTKKEIKLKEFIKRKIKSLNGH